MAGALTAAIAAAFAGSAAPSSDQYFEYTTLLLPGNGTNGAQNNTFLDGSTNNFTITRNGATTQGTFSPFSQTGWGNYFDGTGDYLTATKNAAYEIGSGDFTVEAWVFPTANGALYNSGILSYGANTSTNGWLFGITGTNFGGTLNRVMFEYNYDGTLYLSTSAVTLNAWNHIAVSRSGSNIYVFLNGNLQTTTSTSKTANTNAGDVSVIGSESYSPSDANRIYTGYISNLRLVKGGALYTSNFTPSTTPLTTTVSSGTVSLLTCQSNRFIDNSSNNFTITPAGNTSVVAFSPFNPTASWSAATYGGSGYFDGSGDYLSVADNTAWDFGSGNFTVECWYYPTTSNAQQVMVAQWDGVGGGTGLSWVLFTSNDTNRYLRFATSTNGSGASFDLVSTTSLVLNAWNHVAIVRNGNTFQLYLNGTAATGGSTTSAITLYNATNSLTIGATSSGTQLATGYLSNTRIVKGTAVYTGAFTPPTAPITNAGSTSAASYPSTTNVNTSFASSATSLLLNFTNAGIYDATSKNDLETVGNAQISTTQSKWGGSSISFDGTGDWLLIPDQPPQRIGTGNFTIEMWVYRNSSGTYGLAGKGTGTTGWLVSLNSSNQVVFTYGSSTITSSGTVSATTWTHIAVVREGTSTNQTKIYIGGSNDGTGTVSTDFNQTNSMYIGADRTGGSAANAYVQDVRITSYARYTTNFTPPTAAFPTL